MSEQKVPRLSETVDAIHGAKDAYYEYGEPDISESILSSYTEQVVRARDFVWWSAIVMIDAVRPTPETVKAWVLSERDLAIADAVRAVANEVSAHSTAPSESRGAIERAARKLGLIK